MGQGVAWRQLCIRAGQVWRQVIGNDRHLCPRVGDGVDQFVRAVHRVDGHHNGISAQYAEVRNHQLRRVLHHEQYAVAAFNAPLLQEGGHALDLVQQLRVADFSLQKNESGLVGITASAGDQVIDQWRVWRAEVARDEGWPNRIGDRLFGRGSGVGHSRFMHVAQRAVNGLGDSIGHDGTCRGMGTGIDQNETPQHRVVGVAVDRQRRLK